MSDYQKNCSKLKHSVMKFDRSNKFDLCYYGQVVCEEDSLRLKLNTFGGNFYFAGDGILLPTY